MKLAEVPELLNAPVDPNAVVDETAPAALMARLKTGTVVENVAARAPIVVADTSRLLNGAMITPCVPPLNV